jgi:hypothetical protein
VNVQVVNHNDKVIVDGHCLVFIYLSLLPND